MELWVRSQNKKFLSKVKCFEILEDPNNKNGIGIWNEIDHLGWYKNEKRALEVLDEIQCLIINTGKATPETFEDLRTKVKGKWCINGNSNTAIYEMPEE